jgi:3'-5' exoribonuclease
MTTSTNALLYVGLLREMANSYGEPTKSLAEYLLNDVRFPIWTGAGLSYQHHYGQGGLIRHTYEVVNLCFNVKNYIESVRAPVEMTNNACKIEDKVLFLAALFHDAGKMDAYRIVPTVPETPYAKWETAPFARLIYHIPGSATIWTEACMKAKVKEKDLHNKVLHAILAHHGSREAGSPVAPKTREAWLVHLCDGISARMDDADTWDIIKRN